MEPSQTTGFPEVQDLNTVPRSKPPLLYTASWSSSSSKIFMSQRECVSVHELHAECIELLHDTSMPFCSSAALTSAGCTFLNLCESFHVCLLLCAVSLVCAMALPVCLIETDKIKNNQPHIQSNYESHNVGQVFFSWQIKEKTIKSTNLIYLSFYIKSIHAFVLRRKIKTAPKGDKLV